MPPHSNLAELYAEQQKRMEALRSGAALRDAANRVLDQLPEGDLALWSTSIEGTGLAAACAALRSEPTTWRQVNLMLAPDPGPDERIVVVEPVDGGAAWHQAIELACPQASIVIAADARLLAAA